MRYVDRSGRVAPSVYEGSEMAHHRSVIEGFLNAGIRDERPPSVPGELLRSSEIRRELDFIFSSACAYCETDITTDLQLDFYRPEMGAGDRKGQVDYQYYCWLTTEWKNLYPACSSCNRLKGNHFPVKKRGPVLASIEHLREVERPLLLDPSFDIPTKHFHIDHVGLMYPVTPEGSMTIETLSLNRHDLVSARRKVLEVFRSDLQSLDIRYLELLDKRWFIDRSTRFRGALLIYLFSMLNDIVRFQKRRERDLTPQQRQEMLAEIYRDRDRYLDRPVQPPPPRKFASATPEKFKHYVRRVEIENFRGVERAEFEFPERRSDFTSQIGSIALLGENGAGKSTILQAAAIGCLGIEKATEIGITPAWCLREGAIRGRIVVRFFDTDDINVVEFSRGRVRLAGVTQVEVMVLGYGPYRLPARRELGEPKRRYQYRIHSLFDERHLVNGTFGLKKHFDAGDRKADAVRSLNALLAEHARAKVGGDGQLAIAQDGRGRPMRDLSSGYKSVVTLATDIMDVMYEVWDGATAGQALILIDEVDAHLHPSWRQRIIEALRTTFPRAQFLFTTHDPLTLRGLRREEIAVLENMEDRVTVSAATQVPVEGLSIDQLLTSELFGLDNTADAARNEQLVQYYKLLSKAILSQDERAQLERLRERIGPSLPIGVTKRERIVMAVVDGYLERAGDRSGDAWSPDVIKELLNDLEEAEDAIDQ